MKYVFSRLLIFVAMGSLFLAVILVFRPEEKPNAATKTASIAQAFPSAPNSERILLQGPGGGAWVNNFYKTAEAAMPDNNAVLVKGGADYDIFYYRADGSFEIAMGLSASPAVKDGAENSLFKILGVGKSELCKLKISVSSLTPGGEKEYSPLSFCQSVFRTQ